MGKPLPVALRERVAKYGDEGHGHREAARHFRVWPRFVNELMKLPRVTVHALVVVRLAPRH